MSELLHTIGRGVRSIIDTVNYVAVRVDYAIGLLEKMQQKPRMRLVAGIVFNVQTGKIITMDATPTTLTNAANPAAATRYLGVIDIADGTTLPSVTSSNTALLAIVAATALNASSQFIFGAYPVDTAAETDDSVTVTISLPGQPDIVETFQISGTPVTPPETDTLDASSAVGAWANAPTLPASPV